MKLRRREIQISQEELAARCDLHRTYICDIENGRRNLSLSSMLRIAEALDITVSELTIGIGKMAEPDTRTGNNPRQGLIITAAREQIKQGSVGVRI